MLTATRKITRTLWGKQWDECWQCGRRPGDGIWLETHEIARGIYRAAAIREPAAWIRVCCECHGAGLGSIVHQLALKKIHDPEWYDRVAVNRLRGRMDEAITEAEVDAEVERIMESWCMEVVA